MWLRVLCPGTGFSADAGLQDLGTAETLSSTGRAQKHELSFVTLALIDTAIRYRDKAVDLLCSVAVIAVTRAVSHELLVLATVTSGGGQALVLASTTGLIPPTTRHPPPSQITFANMLH